MHNNSKRTKSRLQRESQTAMTLAGQFIHHLVGRLIPLGEYDNGKSRSMGSRTRAPAIYSPQSERALEEERIAQAVGSLGAVSDTPPAHAWSRTTDTPKRVQKKPPPSQSQSTPQQRLSLSHRVDPQSLAELNAREQEQLRRQAQLKDALLHGNAERVHAALAVASVTEDMLRLAVEHSAGKPPYLDKLLDAYKRRALAFVPESFDKQGIPKTSAHNKVKDTLLQTALLAGIEEAFVADLLRQLPGRVSKNHLLESAKHGPAIFRTVLMSQKWYVFELERIKRQFIGQGVFVDDERVALVYACEGVERRLKERS